MSGRNPRQVTPHKARLMTHTKLIHARQKERGRQTERENDESAQEDSTIIGVNADWCRQFFSFCFLKIGADRNLIHILFFFVVPDDVFAPNYIWKGSYNYRGRKQPITLSITSFNSTTGRVNVTLSNGNMELLLSGMLR